jgi:cullin 3
LEAERSRANHYLHSNTDAPLRKILEDNLLTPHLQTVISMPNSGLDAMIDLDKADDLSRLYRLFVMVPEGMPTLKRALKESVARRGKLINEAGTGVEGGEGEEEEEEPPADVKGKGKAKTRPPNAAAQTLQTALRWVEDVLALKDKFDGVLKGSLSGDREIEATLNEVRHSGISRETYSRML